MRKIWIPLITIGVVAGLWLEFRLLGVDFQPIIEEYSQQYGQSPLRIGRTAPYFQAKTLSGTSLTSTSPPAKFYLYVLDDRFASACLNVECGLQAGKVVALGGNLIGISDPSIAALFGIKTVYNPKPGELLRLLDFAGAWRRFRGESFRHFEATLIVVADQYGRVVKVFSYASLDDIEEVLQKAGYRP